jgi:nucleotide-binding universal stress UspA family protein
VELALLFAETNNAEVRLLHVCDRRTPREQINDFSSQLEEIISKSGFEVQTSIKTIRHDDIARIIIEESMSVDLVILRSIRRRTAGGLAVSNVTMEVIQELTCSLLLFGLPNS